MHRLDPSRLSYQASSVVDGFNTAAPFAHAVLDDFLPQAHAASLARDFPTPQDPIWSDWRKREGHQYGKQGTRNSDQFWRLPDYLYFSLLEFNSSIFLRFLEDLTGLCSLIPDPYFQGGGLHQIVNGGILDIHTDFNDYRRLGLFRRLNVLLYLTSDWEDGDGAELELWDGPPPDGRCVKKVAPIFNRLVVFKTDKTSFHGHTTEWQPLDRTRRSIALYYYTRDPEPGQLYDERTDFQSVVVKNPLD
ncbi:2OG-Fe(II) oxygenase [bacterium]|nr:2OG-Fe(II) oxygenase [bacterium]